MILFTKMFVQILLCISLILLVSNTAYVLQQRREKSIEKKSYPLKRVDFMVTIKSHGKSILENKMEVTPAPLPECTTTLPEECETTAPPATDCEHNSSTAGESACSEPGTYPDPGNCNDFFVCHRARGNGGMQRVNLSCPTGSAFDPEVKGCTRRAAVECGSRGDVISRNVLNK